MSKLAIDRDRSWDTLTTARARLKEVCRVAKEAPSRATHVHCAEAHVQVANLEKDPDQREFHHERAATYRRSAAELRGRRRRRIQR